APMIPQMGFMPALRQASVSKVTVRALHDGKRLAVLLEWQDATRDAVTYMPDRFRDAAAIMTPVGAAPAPNICMGAAGQTTNLWHWKADWQEDIDKGFQDVVDAYPNFYKDTYPFVTAANGKPPFRVPQDFASPEAQSYMPGLAAGNPLSQPVKQSPVEELVSAGFGTATHKTTQGVAGKGVWTNGTWRVVFARTLATDDPEAANLATQKEVPLAFAVWNGSNQEVGARKQLSSFLTLALDPVPPGQPAQETGPARPSFLAQTAAAPITPMPEGLRNFLPTPAYWTSASVFVVVVVSGMLVLSGVVPGGRRRKNDGKENSDDEH
ncbi:MAG: ethylbenzene dehydrogenase-related protein, partial [Chloroflexi bacterium]|nr:ethylbenzene dehydrogenase-related protein [Chloroflexota bacterium]